MPSLVDRAIAEKDFQQMVVDAARLMRWKVYHTWKSLHSAAGFPDLVLARSPRVIFAEIKREGRDATPAQREWLEVLGQCPGVEVYLWRPSDWERIMKVLGK